MKENALSEILYNLIVQANMEKINLETLKKKVAIAWHTYHINDCLALLETEFDSHEELKEWLSELLNS
jgi:hypothetical protein